MNCVEGAQGILKNDIIAEPFSFREFCFTADTVELSYIGRGRNGNIWFGKRSKK
jgi:hypothetical protein